jgi:predicted lipoprotein
MKKLIQLSLVVILCCLCLQCKRKHKDHKPDEDPKTVFDKQAMLTNYADALIIPSYANFKIALDSLMDAYNTFKTSGSINDFQIVKLKFSIAYLKYQRCDLFEFGPAETQVIRANFNIFPTDSTQINSNISAGTYNLALIANLDAKGFPALEYLFFGNAASENSMFALFSNVNRKQYVSDLLAEMSAKTDPVISAWNTSYRNTFVNSLNTDVGSSIGYMVNQLSYELDYLKNAKIGTPLGKKSLNVPVPGSCEAYYMATSVAYAKETLYLIESAYLGRSTSGANGKGFDDYLIHLDAQYNGGSLNDAINAQFALAKTKLAAVPDPLPTQVTTNAATVDAAYIELVKLLVLLKTDMPSSLGVVITYQDGDGD